MPAYVSVDNHAPMHHLENLRKQAKQYLRWHRARHYPVAAAIRMYLSRFSHHDDGQILEADFQLADAQELVARQHGFETWQALKGASTMNQNDQSNTSPVPSFTSIAAHVYVADIASALAFYTDKLGFALDFAYGEPPFYAQVSRDRARIALRLVPTQVFVDGVREREQLLNASITVDSADEIKQLFLAFQVAGVDFHQKLRKEPWGARAFIIVDPDGNLIQFAGPAG